MSTKTSGKGKKPPLKLTPKKRGAKAASVEHAADWKAEFLTALAAGGNITEAARAAGVTRAAAYAAQKLDPIFAAGWEDALEQACDELVKEARRRALKMSDTLLIFLLKAHRPNTYRETTRAETMSVDMGQLSDDQLARLAKGESLAAVLAVARPGGAGAPAPGPDQPAGSAPGGAAPAPGGGGPAADA